MSLLRPSKIIKIKGICRNKPRKIEKAESKLPTCLAQHWGRMTPLVRARSYRLALECMTWVVRIAYNEYMLAF